MTDSNTESFFDLLFYYKYDILIKKLNGESYEHTDIWKIEVF